MQDWVKVIDNYKHKGYSFKEIAEIKSGKEATVYRVSNQEKFFALKIYRDPEQRAFKNTSAYLEGKYYRKPNLRHAIAKGNKFSKKFIHESWIRREFYMLAKIYEKGANVPKVFDWTNNSILMEYVGDLQRTAPRLIDIQLESNQVQLVLDKVLRNIEIFWDLGIVHGDLSEYNVLWWNNEIYIIDFPQAIDIRNNPNCKEFLKRNQDNILQYFHKNYRV